MFKTMRMKIVGKSSMRELGVFIALILLIVFFSITSPHFLKINNLINIVRQISLLGIIAMGMTMIIVCGEIDLSIGAIYGAAAITCGMVLTNGDPVWVALVSALLVGIFLALSMEYSLLTVRFLH